MGHEQRAWKMNPHVSNFDFVVQLLDSRGCKSASAVLKLLVRCCSMLGPAMRVSQHHRFIHLTETEVDAILAKEEAEVVAAMHEEVSFCMCVSVCTTCVEQALNWPSSSFVWKLSAINRLKLFAHFIMFPTLRTLLSSTFGRGTSGEWRDEVLRRSAEVLRDGPEIIRNLLFRTCMQDVFLQQSMFGKNRHEVEFGGLYESVCTNGMMRHLNETFEADGGVAAARTLTTVLGFEDPPPHRHLRRPDVVGAQCIVLQRCVQRIGSIMSATRFDETVWGQTYLRFAKALPPSTVDGTGADTACLHVLDAVIGYENPAQASEAILVRAGAERRSYFPEELTGLLHSVPRLRDYVFRDGRTRESFTALCQQYLELLEMHRKRALAIHIAVRAGGLKGTAALCSSDLQADVNAALITSMIKRFGTRDGERAFVEGIAATAVVAYPTLVGPSFRGDGPLDGAVVELVFRVPVMCEVCDRVNISVDGSEPRTYTVSRKESPEKLQIAVKNFHSGLSQKLCEAFEPIDVLVWQKPAHHMRYCLYDDAEHVTFIAQGSAACGPIEWLYDRMLSNERVDGILLVVCCRSWQYVPLKEHLDQIVRRGGNALAVSFVFSRPEPGDEAKVQAMGATMFAGRVDEFLVEDRGITIARGRGYVNGGAAFGVAVARRIAAMVPERPSRWGPIVTARHPPFKYDIYDVVGMPVGLREISQFELARHNAPTDVWISDSTFVYNVTAVLTFHPGGQKVIMDVAGRCASLIFDRVHGRSHEVQQILKACVVGRVSTMEGSRASLKLEALDAVVKMQNEATNMCRFYAWPRSKQSSPNGSDAPPVFCIERSLLAFAESVDLLLASLGHHEDNGLSGALQSFLCRLAGVSGVRDVVATADTEELLGSVWLHFEGCGAAWNKIHEAIDWCKLEFESVSDDDASVSNCVLALVDRVVAEVAQFPSSR